MIGRLGSDRVSILVRDIRRVVLKAPALVLLALLKGNVRISKLPELTGLSTHAVYNAVNKLLKLGLIEERKEHSPRTREIYLTEKGKIVALKIAELVEVLRVITENERTSLWERNYSYIEEEEPASTSHEPDGMS